MEKGQQNIVKTLISLGLSKREVGVYLAILKLGRGTVTQISRKAGINRTTGYDILAALAQKDLVRLSGKEPKEEYAAESPDKLIALLDSRLSETEQQLRTAKAFLPQLRAMHTVQDRPQVRFYEGIEGLKEVYEDTLTATEPIVAYAAYEDMHATLGNYFPRYYERRAEKGISIRGIVPETTASLERASHNKDEKRDIAIIPKEEFDITPDIEIYDNKIMIASWRDKLGIIIESAEIAHAMKKVFELAWKEAKRSEKAVSGS
ncbi:MAG: helix-turn-helix domain-containing protein [Patescibacteria group bacterium]